MILCVFCTIFNVLCVFIAFLSSFTFHCNTDLFSSFVDTPLVGRSYTCRTSSGECWQTTYKEDLKWSLLSAGCSRAIWAVRCVRRRRTTYYKQHTINHSLTYFWGWQQPARLIAPPPPSQWNTKMYNFLNVYDTALRLRSMFSPTGFPFHRRHYKSSDVALKPISSLFPTLICRSCTVPTVTVVNSVAYMVLLLTYRLFSITALTKSIANANASRRESKQTRGKGPLDLKLFSTTPKYFNIDYLKARCVWHLN